MAWEGLNIEDLNASRLNLALLNCSMLNAAVETRDTGGIAPVPSEDVYVLENAILHSADSVLLAEDGTPIVWN